MPKQISRAAYADMYGPTTGDRLRRVVEQNQDVEKEVRSGGEARTIMCGWH